MRVNDSLQIEILLTRLEAQRLVEVLPSSNERHEIQNTMLACDLLLKDLKSGTITEERNTEMRQSYESSKHRKRSDGVRRAKS
jgi:hypothetical protein